MRLIRLLKHDLARETREWVETGLITQDQAAAICAGYGVDYHQMAQRSRGYWLLIMLGYLFLGMALITLISANWDEIPRAVRMGGLMLLFLTIQALGFRNHRLGKDRAAQGIFFLGSLVYGAAIMLIAQIYHLGEHYPDGVLLWALGVLPLALLLKSRALMLLTVALGSIWGATEAQLGYFPWLFPLFLGAMAWHLLRSSASKTLFMLLVILSGLYAELSISWRIGGWDHADLTLENLFFAGGFGLLCHGLGLFLERSDQPEVKDYAGLISLWALRFLILILFVFSFESAWKELISEPWQAAGPALAGAGLMVLAALALAYAGKREIRPMAVPAGLSLIYLAVMAAMILISDRAYGIWFAMADNLLLVISGIWLIISGIRQAVSHYFFLGVGVILLTGLVRYMDLVGDYIGTTALFAGFAVILLATARFWKKRFSQGDRP